MPIQLLKRGSKVDRLLYERCWNKNKFFWNIEDMGRVVAVGYKKHHYKLKSVASALARVLGIL